MKTLKNFAAMQKFLSDDLKFPECDEFGSFQKGPARLGDFSA